MNEWTAPSRKWMVTQVTALAALATAWLQAGEWSTTLSVMAVGIASQAVIAYLVPNTETQLREQLRDQRGNTEPLMLLVYVIVFVILIVVLFAVIDRL
jgi:cobalamin synthase